MPTARLHPLDMALVAAYLVTVTGLGLWWTRGVKTSRDYFLAGKTLPWWAVGMSLVVSDIGAKDMVGLAADGYRYGLVMMNFDFIGCAFPVLVAAFLFMPFLWMAVSCVVLIVGAALICILGLEQAGGWDGLRHTIGAMPWTKDHFHLVLPADHPAFPWPAVLLGLGFVLGPAYWIGNQAIVQRTLGAGSQNQARASYVFCAVLKLVFPVLLVLPGLIGLALFHDERTCSAPGSRCRGGSNRRLPGRQGGIRRRIRPAPGLAGAAPGPADRPGERPRTLVAERAVLGRSGGDRPDLGLLLLGLIGGAARRHDLMRQHAQRQVDPHHLLSRHVNRLAPVDGHKHHAPREAEGRAGEENAVIVPVAHSVHVGRRQ